MPKIGRCSPRAPRTNGRRRRSTRRDARRRGGRTNGPANTLGIRRIMFAVDDIDDVVARLRAHGAELVGEIDQYKDLYRLCYVRGPEGIIVALAEKLG